MASEHSVRRLLRAITALLMFVGSAALADSEAELGNDIRIENVAVTPASAEGTSRLTFNIINDSSASLHLARVSAPIWKDARLMVSIGPGAARDIGSIGIAEGTALDLRSSHIWYELLPLRGLVPGETFEAVFDLEPC